MSGIYSIGHCINGMNDISGISSKATKTHGFLGRNLASALKSTKKVAYNKTLVLP